MRNVDVNGLSIAFGNQTNKDKYTIYYMLKGQRKMRWIYPKNKENAKKIYQQIILRKPRWVQVHLDKANSVYRYRVATYCPKEFVHGYQRIVYEKQNQKWSEK